MATDLEAAMADPRKAFGDPAAVLQAESLTREQKEQVLEHWFKLAQGSISGTGSDGWGGEQSELERVRAALQQVEAQA